MKTFSKTYTVKEEHIDVQGIVDGLYYPFYMEWCRHDFIREVMGFDFEEQAHAGIYMILSGYKMNFLRSLKKDDTFSVTCAMYADQSGLPRLHFQQDIILNNKVMTRGIFTGTCISANGGRPYLPEGVARFTDSAPKLEVNL